MDLKESCCYWHSALTPIGNTAEEYWQSLQDGVSGAASITRLTQKISKRNLHAKSRF